MVNPHRVRHGAAVAGEASWRVVELETRSARVGGILSGVGDGGRAVVGWLERMAIVPRPQGRAGDSALSGSSER